MRLNRTDAFWDRTTRNSINENWDILEGTTRKMENDFNNFKESVTEEVVDQLVDNAKLDWKEPVDTIEDLPESDPIGTVRQVRQATSDGVSMMYRKYEDGWKVVQEYDATAINDVDSRLTAQMAHTASNVGEFAWWKPPAQPSHNSNDPKYTGEGAFPLNQTNYPYEWIIDKAWDKFINDPKLKGYVTKVTKGKDTSGQYDIYEYHFTPENYEKTVVIGCALHGWEHVGTAVISRIMHHVCYDWKKYPQLAYLRNKVRFVIMPMQNPWGYANQKRNNSNNVDLNRNFDYGWNQYVVTDPAYDNKGTAPESEVETQYIVNTVRSLTGVVAYLDFHNMHAGSGRDFVIYDTAFELSRKDITDTVAANMSQFNIARYSNWNPLTANYFAKIGINATLPEFVIGAINPDNPYGTQEMTAWVEYAANLVLLYAQTDKPQIKMVNEPFNFHLSRDWAANQEFLIAENVFTDIPVSFDFEVPSDGILKVDCSVVYSSTTATNTCHFVPIIGQAGTHFPKSANQAGWEVYQSTYEADKRNAISFSGSIPVKRTAINEICSVGVRARPSNGTLKVLRVRMNVTFIPSYAAGRQRNIVWSNTSNRYIDVGFKFDER